MGDFFDSKVTVRLVLILFKLNFPQLMMMRVLMTKDDYIRHLQYVLPENTLKNFRNNQYMTNTTCQKSTLL